MSTPVALQRSPFTQSVLDNLAELNKKVGDGEIPAGANWVGQVMVPGSVFNPYLVVSEIVASHSSGPLDDPQADWQLPYLIESFGISRTSCGWMADQAREQILLLRSARWTVLDQPYGVQQVRVDSIGEPERVAAVYPPVWHSQDGVTLWIGKGA